MQLSNLKIAAFRSCKNTHFELRTPITCLIGPNGAGKTNVLHALLLMKLNRSPRQTRPEQDKPDFQCKLEAGFSEQSDAPKVLTYKSKIAFAASRRNAEEVLSKEETWRIEGAEGKWKGKQLNQFEFDVLSTELRNMNLRLYGQYQRLNKSYSRQFFSARENLAELQNAPKRIIRAIVGTKSILDKMQYCGASQFTNPALSPTSFEVDQAGDLIDTYTAVRSEHTRLIFNLYKYQEEDPSGYKRFIHAIGKSGLGILGDIVWEEKEFSTTALEVRTASKVINRIEKRKIVIPIISIGNAKLSFNQLSEGTFRTIALVFYILSDANRLLLIEEPEVGIHHGLLNSVIQIMQEVSTRKQIVFSTHSEVVVDQMAPENMCLVENSSEKGTSVKRLTQSLSKNEYKALKAYLADSGNLGEYWRSGGFESWR